MKKVLFFCLLLFIPLLINAQIQLSEAAQISILTSSPSDEAVFTVYGHTAVRVADEPNEIDLIFNYGIFHFGDPYFIYRFTKGETDYILGVNDNFTGYVADYAFRGSSVVEQILNLTKEEKQAIWHALAVNSLPENRVYRYNFFFDNCSTRPVAIIEKYINGTIQYNHPEAPKTFRDMINECTQNKPWQTFGCDLALGSPTDRIATQHEEMFLPEYLMHAFEQAEIITPDGSSRPLVLQTQVLSDITEEEDVPISFFTPFVCAWLFFLLIAGVTFGEWKNKKYFRMMDCILFGIAGLGGCILFFLAFISTHPCTWPNWSLIWLHPFHLLGATLFAVKRWGKAAFYYHFINFAGLTLFLLGWKFIPQHINTAFIPLVMTLWLRSGFGVYRYKSEIKE